MLAAAGSAVASGPPDQNATGPEADYPVVVGATYSIAGTAYKPEDVLNYDAVGHLDADPAGGAAVSGAHHTLPLPSYVEVTSLETGRTILVRLERRGPMSSNALVALSPGAMSQLGASPATPVRVRRVNPPEDQRALLRAGRAAPLRMDTPMSLVSVLKRRLQAPAPVRPPVAPVRPVADVEKPAPARVAATPVAAARPVAAATPVAAARPAAVAHGLIVQAGAFSSAETARKAAKAVGGTVSQAGKLWRVRTGPFATRAAAEASLAKVRAAGYSEARIFTSG